MIEIVSATKLSETNFWNTSALGRSLRRLAYDRRLVSHITFENRRGLPEIINARIVAPDRGDAIVFTHDDVWIDDYFLVDRVIEGLQRFDIIGLAGNRRRVPRQPAWAFIDDKFTWDDKANLSGSVAHGAQAFGGVSYYGPAPAECELLDGIFFAARKSVLVQNGVFFDPRFDFHLLDVDFSRSARQRGLRLGTWPICVTHQSTGAYGSAHWVAMYRKYIEKWGE